MTFVLYKIIYLSELEGMLTVMIGGKTLMTQVIINTNNTPEIKLPNY